MEFMFNGKLISTKSTHITNIAKTETGKAKKKNLTGKVKREENGDERH